MTAPDYKLNGAPVTFHRTLKRYLIDKKDSLKFANLKLEASKSDPCLFFARRSSGPAVGVITTHVDDLLGCGGNDIPGKMEKFPAARFSPAKVQKDNFAHIGMDILHRADGSVELTQLDLTGSLCPIDTSPSPWKGRARTLNDEELQICQGKLG